MDKRKIIYYTDELNDEFSTVKITPKTIDGNYKYCRDNGFGKIICFFWYRIIATPLAFIYTKCAFRHQTVGKEKLKNFRNKGYFIYGNHTQDIGDALIPTLINIPKDVYAIVHPNNVSMPVLGRINPYLGAIPLPDDMAAYKNFTKTIKRRIEENNVIAIYPEAHIWPYYTGIRPFPDTSFQYPVKHDSPVFCFTNTYKRHKNSKKPTIVTYIDGPFYPDSSLPKRQRGKELRDRVYETMTERAKESDMVCIKYIRKEKDD